MKNSFSNMLKGYQVFRKKYASGDHSVMRHLADVGQQPNIMVVACCDSRVDPAVILQCGPGEVFVTRNVANIIPPYENDEGHHGTSAALEFGICYLHVKHLVILGHSQCGGINALLHSKQLKHDDFISNWVSLITIDAKDSKDEDHFAKSALLQSYQHCLTFPWIKERVDQKKLIIHLWYFDIETGEIFTYGHTEKKYQPLG